MPFSIRIKNFGTIKNGFTENDNGYMELHRLTIFIGEQKSGTLRLIAALFHIEKVVNRNLINILCESDFNEYHIFKKYINKYCVDKYITDETEICFKGQCCNFSFKNNQIVIDEIQDNFNYKNPKIAYLPPERNFCAVFENPVKAKKIDISFYQSVMLKQYHKAKINLSKNKSCVADQNQSSLSLISEYLSNRFSNKFFDAAKSLKCFVNIIENPELNLFPDSQKEVLFHLLSCLNKNENNSLLFTTSSPYILPYLNLAIKAVELLKNNPKKIADLKIVPCNAYINGDDVAVYEFLSDGKIRLLPKYKNMPHEDNLLNMTIQTSNNMIY